MKDINLLPEDAREMSEMARARSTDSKVSPVVIVVIVAVVALMILSIFIPRFYVSFLDSKTNTIQQQLSSSTYNEVRRVDEQLTSVNQLISKKKSILDDIDKNNISVAEAVNSIKNSTPKGCYLTKINYDNKTIKVSGVADNVILMNEFMSNLDKLQNMKRTNDSDNLDYRKTNSAYKFDLSLKVGKGEGK